MSRLHRGGTIGLLLLLLSLSVAGIVLDRTNQLQRVKDLVGHFTAPAQGGIASLADRITEARQLFVDAQACKAENQELQALADQLIIENVRLREAEIENVTLREQLSFKQANPSFELLSAQVIGRDPTNLLGYLIVDRGAEEGVAVGMPVITQRGVVGRISESNPHSSKVLIITDVGSSVNALIQDSRATGVVQGTIGQGLAMRYIQQGEEVEVGDLVLSSGLGGNFPTRLIIGQVTAVRQKDVELFQEAEVRPAVNFRALEMVMVLTSFEPVDLESKD